MVLFGGEFVNDASSVDSLSNQFKKYIREENIVCEMVGIAGYIYYPHNYETCYQIEGDQYNNTILNTTLQRLGLGSGIPPCNCLMQFWRAEEVINSVDDDSDEKHFRLITQDQPFMLLGLIRHGSINERICSYRMKMCDVIVAGDGGGGWIGRAFRNKRMEFTPDVSRYSEFYSDMEYPHLDIALSCHIKWALAIPMIDSYGRSIGVVEFVSHITTTEYCMRSILQSILKCDLTSSDCCKVSRQKYVSKKELRSAASEIKKVMKLIGESFGLIFDQTWMLCKSCNSLSTSRRFGFELTDFCMVIDERDTFRLAESFSILRKGEGVVGKAASSSHNLVYCEDVSKFSTADYPLAHLARRYNLSACFAICLTSNDSKDQVYVLEIFLDPRYVDGRNLNAMLVPILKAMKQNFQTLKFASGEELQDNLTVQVIDARFPEKIETLEFGDLVSTDNQMMEMDGNCENMVNTNKERNDLLASPEKQNKNTRTSGYEQGRELPGGIIDSGFSQQPLIEENVVHVGEYIVGITEECIMNSSELTYKRGGTDIRKKELLDLYGLKRKDAAERLKICESTFKHACRFHGISRWPPRGNIADRSSSSKSAQSASRKELRGAAPFVEKESLVTVKAKYKQDGFVTFQLPASSGIDEFNQQVAKWLPGNFIIKYQDLDKDWILIACDDDLQDYISSSILLGNTTLEMSLELV